MLPLISASSVTVTRDNKNILDNVSFDVGVKDFITILGPNGAGKSMLLKCLMGFFKPESGKIDKKAQLRIGYVPQQFTSEQTMPITVERFLQLRKSVPMGDIIAVATETNIETLLKKPLHILSGGERQRILLARSLIGDPELLVLDEPAQNLDISGQLAFYKLLEKIYTTRALSILMVSHDLHMVMATTKQVICLFHHICCSGEPQVVTRDPEFVSLFGHDMAEMMAVYQHGHNHTHAGHSHD
ncbi:ATP-binding cassette domain-containing protein [Rhodospirillaceae bacterium]|jgi:zinc transport system ATP-binding protein|nr:ATP-binding cassette domain-containing protein [Rhodospirillaceae bacterium]MDC1442873.1 ATP-binding cassette domain-containing protein [Rhodospirillaceae bacterium]